MFHVAYNLMIPDQKHDVILIHAEVKTL